jgi:predicted dehydrogenase
MEAFHYRYHPLAHRMLEIIDGGELGTLEHVETALCIPLLLPGDIRYRLDLSGGAMMDAGSYTLRCLSFMMSYTMLCTSLCASGGILMRLTSPSTRMIGGTPDDRCKSEALFLTANASSCAMSTAAMAVLWFARRDRTQG